MKYPYEGNGVGRLANNFLGMNYLKTIKKYKEEIASVVLKPCWDRLTHSFNPFASGPNLKAIKMTNFNHHCPDLRA